MISEGDVRRGGRRCTGQKGDSRGAGRRRTRWPHESSSASSLLFLAIKIVAPASLDEGVRELSLAGKSFDSIWRDPGLESRLRHFKSWCLRICSSSFSRESDPSKYSWSSCVAPPNPMQVCFHVISFLLCDCIILQLIGTKSYARVL
ncbi:hypothetical protein C4D60_Mb02t23150 [Musa balbisiana]|uniref:Uncharacterized protein n=1 Tax=Musa balbisiana TaxID=52838 RepID=A0A4S8ICV2_MUSBA|nr:hypothetical protein C4D60_Mb02t23150 [Musa balbisiana]